MFRSKLGASRSLVEGSFEWPMVRGSFEWPIQALRHLPEHGTTGWYLWTGEFSEDDDFFVPWHTQHLVACVPAIKPHLSLPPGTRFVFAPDYFDVWFDRGLLDA